MPIINVADVSALAGQTISCSCGRTHAVSIRHILTGGGVISGLMEMAKPFFGKTVYLIGDENTLPLGRASVTAQLEAAGCTITEHVFPCPPGGHLVTDERLIGSMLVSMPEGTALIVTIGSGTMNDSARVISARCGIPYIIVGTAPSMDGYASVTSAIVMEGGKRSVPLIAPYGIIGDTDILKTAPDHMLCAGAGDMLGKYVAIRDWALSHRETGEAWCPEIASLVSLAAGRVISRLPRLFDREDQILRELTDALVLSGLAILMHGTSRPAAGLEHQIAHYWEVEAIRASFYEGLHGHYVGMATLAACRMYEMAEREFDLPGREECPTFLQMKEHMHFLREYIHPDVLHITPEAFRAGILHAARPEIRYTLASYLAQKGRLNDFARRLTEEFTS